MVYLIFMLVFNAANLLGSHSQIAQSSSPSLRAWPHALSRVNYLCTDDNVNREDSEVSEAFKVGDDSKAAIWGKSDGEEMGTCYALYHHPYYLLMQAAFYVIADLANQRRGDDSSPQLRAVASSDLSLLASYNMPANIRASYDLLLAKVGSSNSSYAIASSPITIDDTKFYFSDGFDYVTVGIWFKNTDPRTAVAVKFNFTMHDAFGKQLSTETGTIYGTFSTGVAIEPFIRRGDGTYQEQPDHPDSPAWQFYNLYGHDVVSVNVAVASVRFSDGTIWSK
jgi:hypothetical protein